MLKNKILNKNGDNLKNKQFSIFFIFFILSVIFIDFSYAQAYPDENEDQFSIKNTKRGFNHWKKNQSHKEVYESYLRFLKAINSDSLEYEIDGQVGIDKEALQDLSKQGLPVAIDYLKDLQHFDFLKQKTQEKKDARKILNKLENAPLFPQDFQRMTL